MCCGLSQFMGLLLNGSTTRKFKYVFILVFRVAGEFSFLLFVCFGYYFLFCLCVFSCSDTLELLFQQSRKSFILGPVSWAPTLRYDGHS